ncbi:MAG: hypothetical protein K2X43_18080 [Hyphomonadaceae bacterium]|nr:hypothetical protein [Hyphomonadaceae bacterium]
MPSSGRTASRRDRPKRESASRSSGRARTEHAPVEPPRYEPWDPQSAEALTRLYESGEGYLHPRPEDARARRRRPLEPEAPAAPQAGRDNAWLEARLADIAQRLQGSLAEINPDKAVAHLNQRLDAIEARFNEALSGIVQRSDLDGLRIIEAHVLELAQHVEQTRGRLDRLDAIDDRVQGIMHRLEADDQQRLDQLEKLLQDYSAEWRRGEERTASALHNLEGAVNRVGDSLEAMEAQRPAPDLALPLLGTPDADQPAIGSDPLSQVYADAARVLEPSPYRSPLDAADYVPKVEPATEAPPPGQTHALQSLRGRLARHANNPRPTQVQAAQCAPGEQPAEPPAQSAAPAAAPAPARTRAGLLMAGGITLFAVVGYLLVEAVMVTSAAPRRPAGAEHSARPAEAKAAVAPQDRLEAASGSSTVARIEAIGTAMAAAFRRREGATPPPPIESTASISRDVPAPGDEAVSQVMAALPMTIGPASLRQAAMRGDPVAQVEVASRFVAGHGVDRDPQQALQWYGRAATQGSAVAQYRLAALYERGLGAARDTERARVWYTRAAEQGNVKAMHNLAVLSVSGGRSDYAAAAKWFAQAAEFGLTDSQVNLAILHQSGFGVPKDLKQAYAWLALAARGGDQEAASRLSEVKSYLSPAEVAAADVAIAAWRARIPDPRANETAAAVLDSQ